MKKILLLTAVLALALSPLLFSKGAESGDDAKPKCPFTKDKDGDGKLDCVKTDKDCDKLGKAGHNHGEGKPCCAKKGSDGKAKCDKSGKNSDGEPCPHKKAEGEPNCDKHKKADTKAAPCPHHKASKGKATI